MRNDSKRAQEFAKEIEASIEGLGNIELPSRYEPKLYTPSTLNIDLMLWHTHLIVCAENVKSWFKSWVFTFTFQAYILTNTLNCMCVSLLKFHI